MSKFLVFSTCLVRTGFLTRIRNPGYQDFLKDLLTPCSKQSKHTCIESLFIKLLQFCPLHVLMPLPPVSLKEYHKRPQLFCRRQLIILNVPFLLCHYILVSGFIWEGGNCRVWSSRELGNLSLTDLSFYSLCTPHHMLVPALTMVRVITSTIVFLCINSQLVLPWKMALIWIGPSLKYEKRDTLLTFLNEDAPQIFPRRTVLQPLWNFCSVYLHQRSPSCADAWQLPSTVMFESSVWWVEFLATWWTLVIVAFPTQHNWDIFGSFFWPVWIM